MSCTKKKESVVWFPLQSNERLSKLRGFKSELHKEKEIVLSGFLGKVMKGCQNELVILFLNINQNEGKLIPALPEIEINQV